MARRPKLTWREEVLDAAGLRAAGRLASLSAGFYLAGGTGLALRLGHRVSLDLDLFSRENALEAPERQAIVRSLEASGPVEVRESSDGTLHLVLEKTRVSFLRYRYPLLATPDLWRGLAVAAPEDIAAMKLSAIVGRGAKKDFIDLHALAARGGLERLLRAAARKYSDHPDFVLQAARALVFFDDADKDPLPRLLADAGWNEIKAFFEREVPRVVRRLVM
ncbi:MAG: nucleotidyl transferase AbiEii/AbiGii toxin family protein [Elusimicrobia bacterium]|nr:nucleotidyl transferase AbiEii/AbiGii toxin family protein [Elusimicrobiota bacterium]